MLFPARGIQTWPLVVASMFHRMARLLLESTRLVTDERDDHAVEVEEEHDEVKSELDERFLRGARQPPHFSL